MLSQEQKKLGWTWANSAQWSINFPCANGLCQSPINIKTSDTVPKFFSSLNFSSKYDSDLMFTMTNNGQQIQMTFPKDSNEQTGDELYLTGINLIGKYHFSDLHIHWGADNKQGAEHEIDGNRFAGEAHFVHKNKDTQQLAVLAIFLTVSDIGNKSNEWDKYANIASQLTKTDDKTTCVLNLSRLMQMKHTEFYRYEGSLTSPPCTEGIIWTVFPYEVPIKEESLNALRQNILPNTYRPLQPLNGRTVFRNYEHSQTI
ncbi:unnamed protein product [Rotaria socialis]|uniref:carbonic anhydrase n=2 Tax=Rotaria socialis TaxID=392032 RepID=A0A818ST49_9BILA|nr:unnamed protein product [Rotaria socialis]CAF3677080.1 unnamed protein product [Rotaria socialis]CAF4493113.1 unnamed protein product [Rotaria socialis]